MSQNFEISELDNRKFSIETFGNVKTLLVHDPSTKSGAMSISFGAGSNDSEKVGLPHLVEHILFGGSKMHKEDFQTVVSKANGVTNAFTDKENTVFMFKCADTQFKDIAEEFVCLFTDNLFNVEAFDNEKNAVNNEFVKDAVIEGWRENEVILSCIEDSSKSDDDKCVHIPNMVIFGCGNNKTLEEDTIQDAKDFVENFYKNRPVRAVMYSHLSIEELKNIGEETLTKIETSNQERNPEVNGFKSLIGKKIQIEPLGDRDILQINFPIDSYLNKTYDADLLPVATLIDYKKNLPALLYKEKLAFNVESGLSYNYGFGSVFTIEIRLTKEGLDRMDKTVGIVFKFLEKLREKFGIGSQSADVEVDNSDFTDHLKLVKKMIETEFVYRKAVDVFDEVTRLILSLKRNQFEENKVVMATYLDVNKAKEELKRFMREMTYENCFITFTKKFGEEEKGVRIEPWFKAKYKMEDYPRPICTVEELPEIVLIKDKLPSSMELLPFDSSDVIKRNDGLFAINAAQFREPRVLFRMTLQLSETIELTDFLKLSLVSQMMKRYDSEVFADENLAMSSFHIGVSRKSFDVTVNCFSMSFFEVIKIAEERLESLMECKFTEEETNDKKGNFEHFKSEMEKMFENDRICQPYRQAMKVIGRIYDDAKFTEDEALAALAGINAGNFLDIAAKDYRYRTKALLVGNIDGKIIEKCEELLRTFSSKKAKGETEERSSKTPFIEGKLQRTDQSTNEENQNRTLLTVYQSGYSNIYKDTLLQLFQSIAGNSVFYELRTLKQLGYITTSMPIVTRGVVLWCILVQSSNAELKKIDECVEFFMNEFVGQIEKEKGEELKGQIDHAIQKLEEEKRSLGEVFENKWVEVETGREIFDLDEKKIEILKMMRKLNFTEAIAEFAKELKSKEKLKIAVEIQQKGNGVIRTEAEVKEENYQRIEKLTEKEIYDKFYLH